MKHTPKYEKEDIVINFRDMLVHILRHWRGLVIGVLVITLLAGAYQYRQDLSTYEVKLAAQTNKVTAITLEGTSLANANQVLQYQKTYEELANYNRTSLLMQIDPTAVNTQTLSFLITGKRAYSTAAMYQTHLNNLAMYEDIAETVAPDNDPSYIMELVTATLQYESGAIETADTVMLNVKIIAPTKDICATIADEVKTHIFSLQTTVTAALGTHTCQLAAQTEQQSVDTSLKTTQQNNLNNCNTLRYNFENAKKALTTNEKAYVEQMSAINVEDKPVTLTPPSISKKTVILGFFAGVVLMCCVYGISYVFNRKLKSREDFAERYGLFLFGCLSLETQKRVTVTERLIRRWFFKKESAVTEQETLRLAQQQLLLSVRQVAGGVDRLTVYITGSHADIRDHALFTSTKELLAENNIALEAVPCPLYDAQALEKLATADAVVLAETLGASTYDDIYRELDVCDRLGCPILGAFILQ